MVKNQVLPNNVKDKSLIDAILNTKKEFRSKIFTTQLMI